MERTLPPTKLRHAAEINIDNLNGSEWLIFATAIIDLFLNIKLDDSIPIPLHYDALFLGLRPSLLGVCGTTSLGAGLISCRTW